MADQDEQESQLTEDRSAERTGGPLKKLKLAPSDGVSLADKQANRALQKGFDEAKLALLPLFYFVLPLVAIFILILVEMFLPLVRKSWKLPLWRTVVYCVYIFFFLFFVFTTIGTLAYIYQHPGDFCKLALGGNVVGDTGCTVFSGFFKLLFGG